jgi:cytochrome c biogenesis protein CcmG, thiol:disulfide interchange protein DsbE
MAKHLIPLAVFVVLVVFLGVGLQRDPREVPSPLVGKPAPQFQLPRLDDPQKSLALQEMRGQVWLLNVWASWCVSCRDEHPVLVELSKSGVVPIYGLNYKDQRADALNWLNLFGNPYTASISDADGKVGIDYGVYGVPETYVIDKSGVIRYKQIGPVTQDALQKKILPLVASLRQG